MGWLTVVLLICGLELNLEMGVYVGLLALISVGGWVASGRKECTLEVAGVTVELPLYAQVASLVDPRADVGILIGN